jgi:hypothetical protein
VRLGELLVADGLVLAAHVERALATQRRTRARLGAVLVDAGLATADAVARALARQHGVPAALERHLAANDAALAALVPAALARERQAVPIARTRDGGIVIAMRDPGDAAARAALARAVGAPVVAAAACERVLAAHVARLYAADVEGVDVDFDSHTGEHPAGGPPADLLDPNTLRGALVSLDDAGVTRDPRQSDPSIPATRTSGKLPAVAPASPTAGGAALPAPLVELTATLARIAAATSAASIAAAVLAHGAGRAETLLVLGVRPGLAVGEAGFGPALTPAAVQAVTLPLTQPSVIKTAIDTLRPYAGRPPIGGGVQDRILTLLGKPAGLVVAPIAAGGRAVGVLVGAVATTAATDALGTDLVTIAGACGVAHGRLR